MIHVARAFGGLRYLSNGGALHPPWAEEAPQPTKPHLEFDVRTFRNYHDPGAGYSHELSRPLQPTLETLRQLNTLEEVGGDGCLWPSITRRSTVCGEAATVPGFQQRYAMCIFRGPGCDRFRR